MQTYDLLIIGGGINGAAIARDAAGRGLSVCLVEAGDPGGATSWASSKLIHGGLRYLEQFAFRLVRESLAERSILLRTAAHLTRPCRFVLPHVPGMRPAWLMRLGLWAYDHLGESTVANPLPRATQIALAGSEFGAPLQPGLATGFLYFDVQVDDARLVILTLRDAALRGADVLVRHRFLGAAVQDGLWHCRIVNAGGSEENSAETLAARALINAAGPWVTETLATIATLPQHAHNPSVQLVRGSHIVVPSLYAGDHAYTLQNPDGRIVFLLPFHDRWTLIGTTDIRADAPTPNPQPSPAEIHYLCDTASCHLRTPVTPADIVWSYAGLRPLYDDGKGNPAKITRDYKLVHDDAAGAPLLSVFGGKLTTHRHLAEAVLAKLGSHFAHGGPEWTAETPLPGSDGDLPALAGEFFHAFAFLPEAVQRGLWQRHGALAFDLLDQVQSAADLGRDFGAGLTELEVRHFIAHEWAHSADDVLWRRSKAGLAMSAEQSTAFAAWFAGEIAA